ncbi:MAG: hypothetical protein IJH45_00565 [Firmicutes bacterium]|nr:hypothetical protein [Bacillota bacterium]
MSEERKEKFWPAGQLRERGWTDQLMEELLPKPFYRNFGRRRCRCWAKSEVLKAEQTREYQTGRQKRDERKSQSDPGDVQSALALAVEALNEAWQQEAAALNDQPRAEGPAVNVSASEDAALEKASVPAPVISPEWVEKLASHYHQAVCSHMLTVSWADRIKAGQSVSYVQHFLALSRDRAGASVSSTLKHFVTAAPWMGRNLHTSLMDKLRANYRPVLKEIARRALSAFAVSQPEADIAGLLAMTEFPYRELLSHPLNYIYSVFYVPHAIRTSLELLVALNPKDEYPLARAMQRRFVLHIGGTNTGKTYAGFQRLAQAKTGVYLAPLRLLALEAQEIMLDKGIDCSLTTGEEEDKREEDTHVAATAEKLDLQARYEVAVIDECQMISDPERGYAWTRAILGVLAPEVHLCAAPEAKDLLLRIIASCGEECQVVEHRRKTPLYCINRPLDYASVQPGDALITFSKVGVLSVAEDLRSRGKEPAIIYGALPYSTRRKQMEGFLSGRMQYVVSTDAIGMGLNLPIRRIIFMETEKFDGFERRELRPYEIKQIAGRAGRYGMYDKGYVGAIQDPELIRAGLEAVTPPLQQAVAGFSDLVLTVDFDLLEVLEVWNRMPTVEPYVKLDVSRYIFIIGKLRENGFRLTKEQELRAANIPFDETEEELYRLFLHFLDVYRQGEYPERPGLGGKELRNFTLPELELLYRKLDLYFSFAKAFDIDIDREALYDERETIADQINQILLHNLRNNIRFCPQCGAALPLYHTGRLCDKCFRRHYLARNARSRR